MEIGPADPLTRLLLAYAPVHERVGYALLWALDERLAALARTTSEPMIAQMRIAWWEQALTDDQGVAGRGEPLVDAFRAAGMTASLGVLAMLDGWEALICADVGDEDAMRQFAIGRGAGLFQALARADDPPPPSLAAAGALWALWDLSGHLGNEKARASAADLAGEWLAGASTGAWPRAWKPLRIATGLAAHDIRRGHPGAAGLTPGRYARLLRIALVGR
jgi:phytoene synthase